MVLLLIEPRNVIARNFKRRVQRNDIVQINFHSASVHAIHNSLQLVTIFLLNLRPQNISRSVTEETPIALRSVRGVEFVRIQRVVDVMRQPVAVLKSNLRRRAFGVNVNPAAAIEAIRFCEASVLRLRGYFNYRSAARRSRRRSADATGASRSRQPN